MREHWPLKAIRYCGSQKELARRMGVKPEQVSYLLNSARKISFEKALLIQKATDGKINYRLFLEPDQERISNHWQKNADLTSTVRYLSISARTELGIAYEKHLEKIKKTKNKSENGENFPILPLRKEALAAEYAQFNNYRTYRDAKYVVKRGTSELIQAMDSQRVAISTAAQLLRYSPNEQQRILTLSSKEIIAYARRLTKKTTLLPKTPIPLWVVTFFWTIAMQKNNQYNQKEVFNE